MRSFIHGNKAFFGSISAIVAVFCFSINDVAIKFLSGDYALHLIILVRSIVGLIVLFLINVWWIISSAYFLTIEGFDLITQGDGTLDYIFYSVYLKWILLADAIWISAALIFMKFPL